MNTKVEEEYKMVEFEISAPQAEKVVLTGDFNGWDRNSYLLKKYSGGTWKISLKLKPGRYEYKFRVDDEWCDDPYCNVYVPNSLGTKNAVVEIKDSSENHESKHNI
ncbi:MAG: isoamylase early set domain-containing protein [Candidatus Heimdallarchaeota archaeon]